MPTTKKKSSFLNSEESAAVEESLKDMVMNSLYNTGSSYSANADTYPDHKIPFVDKHMNYLSSHPGIDPQLYLSNLRLMTRLR